MSPAGERPDATVVVVVVAGVGRLERCLDALDRQVAAPPFDVAVAAPAVASDEAERVVARHPRARVVRVGEERSTLELTTLGVRAATGAFVLLTEDHCVPGPDWVRTLVEALVPGRGAVGGAIETDATAGAVDWALFAADFNRYLPPVSEGESPTLSVCNVAYRQRDLKAIAPVWSAGFHEMVVHESIRRFFGPLWLVPGAAVRMRRRVRLADAVRERYTGGRRFAVERLGAEGGAGRRLFYSVAAAALPALLVGRMASASLRRPAARAPFLRALPAAALLALAWSGGEWLGYLTGRPPRALVVAPDLGGEAEASPAAARRIAREERVVGGSPLHVERGPAAGAEADPADRDERGGVPQRADGDRHPPDGRG